MKTILVLSALILSFAVACLGQASALASGEDRFKADLLIVVAHPDDETVVGSYLARAIFDQHKRVAVVFGTRGNSGGDEVGSQQAASLGAIREIEGRRALASYGITNVWFLDAPDTPGQDVLRSLETWGHGRSLDRLVRYVRLTRPDVIITWLPAYSAGENHGDHQAAGVLATEAFDIAGDASAYPEQIAAPRNAKGISNLTEGLHPWQAKKIYYATDATDTSFLKGQGPEYSSTEVSPSKGVAYERLGAEEAAYHLTQSDSGYAAAVAIQKNDIAKTYLHLPVQLALGRSHVDAATTADVFAGITSERIGFHAAPGYRETAPTEPVLQLGGPWQFYRRFWPAHGIGHVGNLLKPELLAGVSTTVTIPFVVDNPSAQKLEVTFATELPRGWQLHSVPKTAEVGAHDSYAGFLTAVAPGAVDSAWRNLSIRANTPTGDIGALTVRVQIGASSLPQ